MFTLPKLNVTWRPVILGLALGLVLSFDILLGAWTFDIATLNCDRVNALSVAQQQSAQRALNSLPNLAYYREHPGELKVAQRELRHIVRSFAPKACSLF